MTRDKPFGKYAHNLLVHAPIQYRIISGESINAEEEERTFNTIQCINKGMCFPCIDNIKNDEKVLDVYCKIKIGKKLLQSSNISF